MNTVWLRLKIFRTLEQLKAMNCLEIFALNSLKFQHSNTNTNLPTQHTRVLEFWIRLADKTDPQVQGTQKMGLSLRA